jgi:exopolysaccharide biosynthesis protein
MRNGIVFSQNQAQDILAFYPNDLTIKVFKPKTITVEELKAQGVSNTFSFGPTMLNNGVRDLSSRRSRLGKTNPRSGLGMVEPGHFIAITVDGRQKNYSVGMSIEEFTQLFYLNGCQIAYNLDGGASAAMIFMGECLNQHSGIDSDVQRPWTDGLFWGFSELVPSVDDPVYNDGSKPWVMPPA